MVSATSEVFRLTPLPLPQPVHCLFWHQNQTQASAQPRTLESVLARERAIDAKKLVVVDNSWLIWSALAWASKAFVCQELM